MCADSAPPRRSNCRNGLARIFAHTRIRTGRRRELRRLEKPWPDRLHNGRMMLTGHFPVGDLYRTDRLSLGENLPHAAPFSGDR